MSIQNESPLLYRFKRIQGLQGQACAQAKQIMTECHYLIAGIHIEGRIVIGGKSYLVNRDAFYYCPPGESLRLALHYKNDALLFLISFEAFRTPFNGQQLEPLFPTESRLISSEQAILLCHSLLALKPNSSYLFMQAKLYELLHNISNHLQNTKEDIIDRLEQSRSYIRNSFSSKLTIDSLAQIVHISPKYYMELFSKQYGISAMQYVNKVRIDAAKHQLARKKDKLRQIAHTCGFSDELYFSRRFKQETGITPAAFRRTRSLKIAVLDTIFLGMLAPLHFIPSAAPMHPLWRAHYEELFGDAVQIRLSVGRSPSILAENIRNLLDSNQTFDYIFCPDTLSEQQYEQLKGIGSLVAVNMNTKTWQESFLYFAYKLNATNEAAAWLDHYNQTIQSIAEKLAKQKACHRILFLLVEGDEVFIHYDHTSANILFEELGLLPATEVQPNVRKVTTISELIAINPDYIFALVYQDDKTIQRWSELQTNEDWMELAVVRSAQVRILNPFPWRDDAPLARALIAQEALKLLTDFRP